MGIIETGSSLLEKLNPKVLRATERAAKKIPAVRERLEREYQKMMAGMRGKLRPYADAPSMRKLPAQGQSHAQVLGSIREMAAREAGRWQEGRVSGAVYNGVPEHVAFVNEAYAATSQTNPLHADLWPSVTKYEAEIIAMTAAMLGADAAREHDSANPICGAVSSGGTESIFLAMKTYRDWARETKGITQPQVIAPSTAHPAFDKAAHCLGIEMIRVPVGPDFRADVAATKRAMTRRTIALIGSAPSFPHGQVDPIEALSELARKKKIGFHTDACLGGFILPWARKLGYDVPVFDFSLPGVTSMSADTHKYGFAAKGTSVVLYRGTELRSHQYFTTSSWPGGLYCSPTLAGSRPGGIIAACWAAMVATGEAGYLESAKAIFESAKKIADGVRATPELVLYGNPLFVVAFGAKDRSLDIYRVMDRLSTRGWGLVGLQRPAGIHLCLTLRHTQAGVAEKFVADLRAAVDEAKSGAKEPGGMAPMYGMAATVPFRGIVDDVLKKYLDVLYEV